MTKRPRPNPQFDPNQFERNLIQRIFLILLLSLSHVVWAAPEYKKVAEILVGGNGGWDYVSLDSSAHRLYLSHSTKIVVVDLVKRKLTGEILDTPGVHGFALAPELNRGFSSNGKEAKISIVDLSTLKTLSKSATGENPDTIVYEPSVQEAYAFNGKDDTVTIVQAKTGKISATLKLDGRPEFAAVDARAQRVFVNIEDKSEVQAIDSKTRHMIATWPLAPCESPSGMSIDPKNHRLVIGCHNQLMAVMNSTSGKILSTAPIGKGVDATAFDPGTQLTFSSNGDGTVTIAQMDKAGKLTVTQNLVTQKGSRTMALDPSTHLIYLPAATFQPAVDGHRPQIVPGSLKLLIFGF